MGSSTALFIPKPRHMFKNKQDQFSLQIYCVCLTNDQRTGSCRWNKHGPDNLQIWVIEREVVEIVHYVNDYVTGYSILISLYLKTELVSSQVRKVTRGTDITRDQMGPHPFHITLHSQVDRTLQTSLRGCNIFGPRETDYPQCFAN